MQPRPALCTFPTQYPSTNITTDLIQSYLDENKKLILAIVDNQSIGREAESAQYRAQFQQNLAYLAAIADVQQLPPAVPSQMRPFSAMQQGGGNFPQHPKFAASQQSMYSPKVLMEYSQQMKEQLQLHQHPSMMQAHMDMRLGPNNGQHAMHVEAILGSNGALSAYGHGSASNVSIDSQRSKPEGRTVLDGGSSDGDDGSPSSAIDPEVDEEQAYVRV